MDEQMEATADSVSACYHRLLAKRQELVKQIEELDEKLRPLFEVMMMLDREEKRQKKKVIHPDSAPA